MTLKQVLRQNIIEAQRGLHALDYANGVPVARHALESILKRCRYAIEGGYDDVTSDDGANPAQR